VGLEEAADDRTLRLVRARGRRGEGEPGVSLDQVVVEHRQERVDALLGAQPAGVQDPDLFGVAGSPRLAAEARFGERVDDLDRGHVDVEELRPELGGEPTGGDQATIPGALDRRVPQVFAQRWRDMQDLVRRGLGRDDGELGDEHDRAVEIADFGHRRQGPEGDVTELVTAIGGADADRDHL
jgi:hypothetical protein